LPAFALVPVFYFDLHNDLDVADREGRDLSGMEAARENALCEAREMIAANVGEGRIDLNHFIQVRDEADNIVHRLLFGDAIIIVPRRETEGGTLA